MRTTVTAAVLATALAFGLAPAPALADRAECPAKLEAAYSAYWHAVAHKADHGKLRKDAQGRNIRRWGIELPARAKRDWKPAPCHTMRTSLGQLKRLQHPPRYPTLTRTAGASRPPADVAAASARATGAPLSAIRSCESGSSGGYSADTGNGFYGAYQFTMSTWASVGGTGNPANASAAEQDMRAAMLYAREGPTPWPVCGR